MPKRFVLFPLFLFCLGLWAGGPGAPLARAEGAAATAAAAEPVYPFQRLLIADSQAKAAALKTPPGAGVVFAQDVPVLATQEFTDAIKPYLGQPISIEMVKRLANDVLTYLRQHDRYAAGIVVPSPQDITGGEVRLAVVLGRYKDVQVRGNRWFSREQLQASLGLKPGDEVRLSTLDEAVNWTNANPFRRIKVLVNNLETEPGMADLVVDVQERLPLRFAASYDNTGIELVGLNHYTASIQFGNVWGLDHQASYQYTTTDRTYLYQAHAADYRIPLPWRHYLQVAGSYSRIAPEFYEGRGVLVGENIVSSLRYIAPMQRAAVSLEFSGGVDFKRSNNNIEWGGEQVFAAKNDVFQAALGLTAVRRDPVGAWVFAVNVNASPGHFDPHNTDSVLGEARYGAKARYLTGTFVVQRFTTLPGGFQLLSRLQFQKASTNLVGSEQFSIGGLGTVRGYNQNIVAGDEGHLLSHELQGPVWKHALAFLPKKMSPMESRLVAFWDYAAVWTKFPSDGPSVPLMSAGLGVRCNVATNFSLSADYGWQLLETTPAQPNRGRGTIKVTLAY